MPSIALWVAIGYLFGSLPTAYIVARGARGIDIRKYGSGNVGGSNVYQHVGVLAAAFVGVADGLKAIAAAELALLLTGDAAAQAAAGLGAVLGHCWSPWLRLAGGRGMAPSVGALLTLWLPAPAYMTVVHLLGSAFRFAAPADLMAMATLPALAIAFTDNRPLVWLCLGLFLAIAAKRLHANGLPLPPQSRDRRLVLLRRLFLDRDVPRDQEWVGRRPRQ